MDRVNFFADQVVTPSELDTAFDDVENAINALKSKAVGQGIIWGGKTTKNVGDTLSVDVAAIYGHATPNGETIAITSSSNIRITHTGQTQIGEGGQADGSAITVPSGHRVWVSIAIKPERKYEDIRKVSPTEYWRLWESYKFVLAASSSVEAPNFPQRPTIPAMESYLLLVDVLLKNTDGVTAVEYIDHSRRTPWTGGKKDLFHLGSPAIINHIRWKAYDDIIGGDPADPPDVEEFYTLALGLSQDYAGQIIWTMDGAFLIQEPAIKSTNAKHSVLVTLPVLNNGTSVVTRELIIKANPYNAGVGADFMEFQYFLMGAPLTEDGWANFDDGKHVFAEDSHADFSVNLDFQPGRNILRLVFRNIEDESLTAHVASKILDHENLTVDRGMMAGLLHNHNHEIFFGEGIE